MHRIYRMTVTVLALAGFALIGMSASAQQQQDQQSSGQQSGQHSSQTGQHDQSGNQSMSSQGSQGAMGAQSNLGPGFQQKDVDRNAVDKTIAGLTNAALTRGGFGDFTDYFTDADSDRLQSQKAPTDNLDRAVDQFRAAWQSKYNQDFNPKKQTDAFGGNFLTATGAQVTDPNQVTNWPVGSSSAMSATQGQQGQQAQRDQALKKGSEVAVVSIQSQSGQSPAQLSLVRELIGGWKIDLPDNVSAQDLEASLTRHIQEATQASSQWPTDQAQAYQTVARHVVQAIDESSRNAGQSGGSQSGSQSGMSGSQSGSQSGMSGSQSDTQSGSQQSGATGGAQGGTQGSTQSGGSQGQSGY